MTTKKALIIALCSLIAGGLLTWYVQYEIQIHKYASAYVQLVQQYQQQQAQQQK